MSKHSIDGGDVKGLLNRFKTLRAKAQARTGRSFPLAVIYEAGLDGFWIHRVLEQEGIESHVVDAASVLTSRRRRKAKTDRIDGEALLRTLLAYKRGEPRVCAMVRPPSPEEEDRRRLCRERKTLVAERIAHVNRIKGLLFAQGISDYEPLHRDRRERLEQLTTGDGRSLPAHLKAQIGRELDRLELTLQQLKAVEAERDALLAPEGEAAPAPVAALAGLRGIGPEFAAVLWLSASSAASATGGRWRPMPGWRRRPGSADRLITSRAYPIGKPETAQHHGPARLVVAAAPADLGTEPLVQGARQTAWRPRPEGGNCRPGAQAARGAVAVREQRRRDRGRGDEGRLSAATAASAFGRTLIRS